MVRAALAGRAFVPAGTNARVTRSLPHGHVAAVHAQANVQATAPIVQAVTKGTRAVVSGAAWRARRRGGNPGFGGGFFGDYTDLSVGSDGQFHAVWTDSTKVPAYEA